MICNSATRRDSRRTACRRLGQRGVAVIAALAMTAANVLAVEVKHWESTGYRVRVQLAVDATFRPQPALEAAIARWIEQRVDATLAPLWRMELQIAGDPAARRFCRRLAPIPFDELPADAKDFDKLLWLHVEAVPEGYVLRCREFDVYIRRWGSVHERTVAQSSFLAEACFAMLHDAFAPLAVVNALPDDVQQVQLTFKGSAMPRRPDAEAFTQPGEAFQPLLRRTDRSGALVENGVQNVPWTLLTAEEKTEQGWLAAVHSGMRRAFGMRRGGLVEQLAIAIRNPPGPSTVRFHARSDAEQGLAGYEVFRETADGGSELVGVTDRNGGVVIPAGDGPFSMLLLRSDGQLLAKLPVAAGAAETLETPIADNASRLRAQSEARVMREQLIDVVARRAILMGRVRALLKAGRAEDAEKAMDQLDSLPSPSVFSRAIDAVAQRIPESDDARVQETIDKLFSTTRDMLGKFLDPRPVSELQTEVNAASRQGS